MALDEEQIRAFRTDEISLTFFSMYSESRWRIVSRIPPDSPAAIMFVNRSSKTFGCFFMALASVEPDSTSCLT